MLGIAMRRKSTVGQREGENYMVKQRKVKPIGKVRDLIRDTSQVPTTEEKSTYKVRELGISKRKHKGGKRCCEMRKFSDIKCCKISNR